jgi:hypothetical protein
MGRKPRASNNSGGCSYELGLFKRLGRFFVECAEEFHYRKGFL